VLDAGTYQWQAVFTSTNGQNSNATSQCGTEAFSVNPNSPTLSTTAQVSTDGGTTYSPITGNIAVGNLVRDTSSLSGAATPVAGNVVYTLYSGNGCDTSTNTPTGTVEYQTGSLAVSSATPPNSGSFTVTTAGTYQWQAVFTTGNGQNNSATSPCGSEVFTVNPNSPMLSTTAQVSTDGGTTYSPIVGNIAIGNVVRDTSSLSSAATPVAGTIVYTLYSGSGCSSNTPTGAIEYQTSALAVSSATPPPSGSFTVTTAGAYQWQAVFTSTNGQNISATSACGTEGFTVNPNSPTLSTTAQVSTDGGTTYSPITGNIAIGNLVRDTSSLSGAATPVAGSVVYTLYNGNGCNANTPTGTVAFQTGSLPVTGATPPASGSFTVTTAGTYQWQAVFTTGNGQNNNATSPCGSEDFTVGPNAPSLSTTAQSSTDNVTFGPITSTLAINDFVRDTSSLSGTAAPVAGTIVYTLYSGNGCSSNAPTGAVEFQSGSLAVTSATPPASGSFQVTTAGTYQWQAVFTSTNGQNGNATSACGSEVFTVGPNSPTLSTTAQVSTDGGTTYNPISGNIAIGNLVRDTSSLSGAATPVAGSVVYTLYSGSGCSSNAPTGTVEFKTGSLAVSSATPPASGSFTVTTAGTYQWQAVFTTGNGQNNSATSPCGSEVFTVNPNAPTLSTTAQSSKDNVTFSDITGPVTIGTFVRDTSSLTGTAAPVAGTIVYTLYSGNGCDSNAPTGTVEFQTGSLAVTSATPPASDSFQVTTAGTYQWQAVYTTSNGQNNSATSPCGSEVFTVNPNSPTLSTIAQVSTDGGTTFNPITGNIAIGNTVRDTSSLSGAATPATGNVTYNLYDGSDCNSSTNAPSGSLVFTSVVALGSPSAGFGITTAGTYQWQAVYTSGNGQNNNATSPCGSEVFTVNSNSPTLSTIAQVSTDGGTTYNPITGDIAIGNVVRDTSSLSGAATPVAGTVVYTLYSGNGCDSNAPTGTVEFQTGSLAVTSATLPDSGSFTVTTAGAYQWQAAFTSTNGRTTAPRRNVGPRTSPSARTRRR
jgi:hypothetical protein